MAVEKNDSANQQIDTSQPKILRGLKLLGQHLVPTVQCEHPDDPERTITVNAEDYDPDIHGDKIDKIPKRKKKASKKKASKKKGESEDDE